MPRKCLTLQETKQSLFTRLWSNTTIGDGCWEWLGSKSPFGYGQISGSFNGARRTLRTSRVAWFLRLGKWSRRLILHKCDNPACVRFSHLFEGSQKDNMYDRNKKGRANFHQHVQCKRGHDLSSAYVYRGMKFCRECKKIRWRENKQSNGKRR